MYTRCHPITSIFQKTIFLKESKCNIIMHRQLHSESLVTFSKIENKLKPLNRCFSRAPNNKDSNSNTRNIEAIGLTDKSVPNKTFIIPKFPRDMLEQQFDPNQSHLRYVPNNNPGSDTFSMSMNNSTQNSKGSGSITIVINKSDICNSTSPNEDVTIHVTTVPKISSKRIIETLSQGEIANICSAKCSCCQKCEEFKKLANPRPNSMLIPSLNNGMNILNNFPRRQQTLSGIPIRSTSVINEGFKSPDVHPGQLKRSRSMENFQVMRKMVVPSNFDLKQSNIGPQKQKQSQPASSIHRGSSKSTLIPTSPIYSNRKHLHMPRAMEKNKRVKAVEQSQPMRQMQPIPLVHRGRSARGVISSDKPLPNPHRERSESGLNVSRNINIRQKEKRLAMPKTTRPNLLKNQTKQIQRERSQNRPISLPNKINQHPAIRQRQVEASLQNERSQNRVNDPGNLINNHKQLVKAQAIEPNLHRIQLGQSQQRGRSERKTLLSGSFKNHPPVPNLRMKQVERSHQNPSFNRGISRNSLILSGNKNQKQVIMQRTMKSELDQSQIKSPLKKHLSQNQISSRPQQQPLRTVQAFKNLAQPGKSQNQNDSVSRRQQPSPPQSSLPTKYSLTPNFIMEKSMENQKVNGRDINKLQNPINRVLKPSSVSNVDTRAINQPKNVTFIGTQKQRFFNFHSKNTNHSSGVLPFGRKTGLINQLPILPKKKFPENGLNLPKMLKIVNENNSKLAIRGTVPKLRQESPFLLTPHRTSLQQNVSTKSNFVLTHPQATSKRRNDSRAPSPSLRSTHTQSPRIILTKTSVLTPMLNSKLGIKNRQQNVFLNSNFTNQQMFARKQRGPTIPWPRYSLTPQGRSGKQSLVQKQPPKLVVRQRTALRPTYNLHSRMKNLLPQNLSLVGNFVRQQTPLIAFKQRIPELPQSKLRNLMPVPAIMSLSQRNFVARQYFPQPQLQAAFGQRNTTPAQHMQENSLIPLRKNLSGQKLFLQKNFLQKPPLPTILKEIQPVGSPYNIVQSQNTAHPRMTIHKFVEATQRNFTSQDQKQKRNDIERMNLEKLQSSLPVSASKKPNEITKYVGSPKSLQPVIKPNTNMNLQNPSSNNFQMEKMPPLSTIVHQNLLKRFKFSNRRDKITRTFNNDPKAPTPNNVNQNANNVSNANPAVLFHAPGKLRLISTPMPRLSDEKGVIVKMLYVYITDVDAQMLASVQDGPYKLSEPTLAGKCGSGVIVDVGKQIQNVKIGDRVSIKPVSCGKCSACQNNNALMCKRVPISEKFGIMKKFHAIPAKFVTKLPNKVNSIDGAMMGDLSSAIRACKKSAVTAGDNVLVLDAGSLGLWTALTAKSMGATNVCLADTRASVLEQAKKLGIDRLFLINSNAPISNTSRDISEYMEGDNPRIIFDCSGSTFTNQIAIKTAKMGGKVVLMKNYGSNQPIVLSDAIHRGVDILSSQHGNDNSDRAALQFLASGKVQLNGIDSRFFDISNVNEAFRLLASGTNSNIFIELNRIDEESNAKEKHGTS